MATLLEREYNPFTQAFEEIHFDYTNDTLHLRDVADLTSLTEANKIQRNDESNGFSLERGFRKIAEIDAITQIKLKKDYDIDMDRWNYEDQKKFKVWLRDRDNVQFKTCSGAI